MEEQLRRFEGKRIDVSFGNTSVVRGKVGNVANGILSLDDEEGNTVYVAVDRIAFFLKVKDSETKAGFLNSIG